MRLLDFLDRKLEARRFAGHVLAVIISRKAQIKSLARADSQPDRSGFELGQHLFFTDNERKIVSLAASELGAVDLAEEIHSHAIPVGCSPLHIVEMPALFAQYLQRLVHFRLAHRERRALNVACAEVAQHHIGINLEGSAEFHVFGVRLPLLGLDVRVAGHLEVLLTYRIAERFFHRGADHFGTHLRPILLCNDFQRHLARAKTR